MRGGEALVIPACAANNVENAQMSANTASLPSASSSSRTIAVIDFETTGMTPAQGARATEIAIVLLQDGQVVDKFQSLMRTGVYIPSFITQLTGITNAMVADAPDAEYVMREAARFVNNAPMVAHNASFDSKFWCAEMQHAGLAATHPFACTVLLSRRMYPEARSHSLGSIVDHLGLPRAGRAHRALADAEMAASLLARIQQDLQTRWGIAQPGHELLSGLQKCARAAVPKWLGTHANVCL